MNLKKQPLSPILVTIAMILVIMSRLRHNGSLDWIGYVAIVVLLASVVKLFLMYRQPK